MSITMPLSRRQCRCQHHRHDDHADRDHDHEDAAAAVAEDAAAAMSGEGHRPQKNSEGGKRGGGPPRCFFEADVVFLHLIHWGRRPKVYNLAAEQAIESPCNTTLVDQSSQCGPIFCFLVLLLVQKL